MTLFEVEELTRYWIDHPPLHLMVAAYLGLGKGNRKRVGAQSTAAKRPGMGANLDVGGVLAELGPSFSGGGCACRPRPRGPRFHRAEAQGQIG